MTKVDVRVAKVNLSRLIARVQKGEEIVITRNGRPVAKVVAMRARSIRRFGALKGQIKVGPEFFEPIPQNELKAWD